MSKFAILIPALTAILAVPAAAQQVSVSIAYGDLDLTGPTGVKRLDQRIGNAVEQVCGIAREQKALSSARASRKCGREVWGDVANQRRLAIARARGRLPSVELAEADPPMLAVRRL